MTLSGEILLGLVIPVVQWMLALALLLALMRLVRGPSLPDRVVALDLIAMVVLGMIAVQQVQSRSPQLLNSAMVLALIAFLGTVAFARYLERGVKR